MKVRSETNCILLCWLKKRKLARIVKKDAYQRCGGKGHSGNEEEGKGETGLEEKEENGTKQREGEREMRKETERGDAGRLSRL